MQTVAAHSHWRNEPAPESPVVVTWKTTDPALVTVTALIAEADKGSVAQSSNSATHSPQEVPCAQESLGPELLRIATGPRSRQVQLGRGCAPGRRAVRFLGGSFLPSDLRTGHEPWSPSLPVTK